MSSQSPGGYSFVNPSETRMSVYYQDDKARTRIGASQNINHAYTMTLQHDKDVSTIFADNGASNYTIKNKSKQKNKRVRTKRKMKNKKHKNKNNNIERDEHLHISGAYERLQSSAESAKKHLEHAQELLIKIKFEINKSTKGNKMLK
eukprot:260755_1